MRLVVRKQFECLNKVEKHYMSTIFFYGFFMKNINLHWILTD